MLTSPLCRFGEFKDAKVDQQRGVGGLMMLPAVHFLGCVLSEYLKWNSSDLIHLANSGTDNSHHPSIIGNMSS